jgi:HEPN domain-containing protein
MKPSPEAGLRWLRQAEHDLDIAQSHCDRNNFSDACFMSEQANKKALKGFLIAQGRRSVPIHSVARLAEDCSRIDKAFSSHIAACQILDQYYIPTRDPDALAPPAVPFESYTQEQGEKAVLAAKAIVSLVRLKLRNRKKA